MIYCQIPGLPAANVAWSQYLSMVNMGAIYCGTFGVGTLREFGLRGFDYVSWIGPRGHY